MAGKDLNGLYSTNPYDAITLQSLFRLVAQKNDGGMETGAITVGDLKTWLQANFDNATTSDAGLLSDTDKTKLDSIESGATQDQISDEVPYTNTISGLSATNVRDAIDEMVASTISALVDDTTPKLGADLDCDTKKITNFNNLIYNTTINEVGVGAAIDWTLGDIQTLTLTQDETITFTDPSGPTKLILKVIQDASGGWNILGFPASVKWLETETVWSEGTSAQVSIIDLFFDGVDYWVRSSEWI